jgi:hypothetical protein
VATANGPGDVRVAIGIAAVELIPVVQIDGISSASSGCFVQESNCFAQYMLNRFGM